jgi:hypothetical protein
MSAKRKLYPTQGPERFLLWMGLLGFTAIAIMIRLSPIAFGWLDWLSFVMILVAWWALIYFIQTPSYVEFTEYSEVRQTLRDIEGQVAILGDFLKQEHQKFKISDAVVARLKAEHAELTPMVNAERVTVRAVLAAHARETASTVWKERAIGFVSGFLTSLIGSMVFSYLHK